MLLVERKWGLTPIFYDAAMRLPLTAFAACAPQLIASRIAAAQIRPAKRLSMSASLSCQT